PLPPLEAAALRRGRPDGLHHLAFAPAQPAGRLRVAAGLSVRPVHHRVAPALWRCRARLGLPHHRDPVLRRSQPDVSGRRGRIRRPHLHRGQGAARLSAARTRGFGAGRLGPQPRQPPGSRRVRASPRADGGPPAALRAVGCGRRCPRLRRPPGMKLSVFGSRLVDAGESAWQRLQGRRAWPWVALFTFLWLAATTWMYPLLLPDEGRYVGVAWHMLASGDFLTPRLDGLPFFHKPPLFYWLTAASLSVFGDNAWAGRLCSVLAATVLVTVFYVFLRRYVGGRAAGRP